MIPRHLYVHVPFCARRCTYCDFSIAVRRATPVTEYLTALGTELAMVARELGVTGRPPLVRDATGEPALPCDSRGRPVLPRDVAGGPPLFRDPTGGPAPLRDETDRPTVPEWVLDTLSLGGGTPSRLGTGIEQLLDLIRGHAILAPDAEVTLEANPEDVTPDNAQSWRRAGVNRISLGAQSFDDSVLGWMHRVHSAEQIGRAVEIARGSGFDNISLDLIFALPKSLRRDWRRDLDAALALEPAHVSLYGLTVEPRTPLSRRLDRGEVREAGEDAYEAEFLLAHDTLTAAGFDHYEVSNFARPGRHSRHNSAYWSGAAYAGIGPSAHSFDGIRRWWNVAAYTAWHQRLTANETPVAEAEVLDEENLSNEQVYLGLRTHNGVRVGADELAELQPWLDRGWATLSEPVAVGNPADAGVVTPGWSPSRERLSRRRSSRGGLHPGAATATIPSPARSSSKLSLTATGWLLLDELATSLTWIRSRSYV